MIKLIKAFPYDNRYDYVKMFATKQEQNNYFNSLPSIRVDDTNYIKMHKTINVKYSFDYLESEGINYIIFNNGYKDIYAFIVNKRYVREELTELIYEVDVIQTYMFDFTLKKSYVERKVSSLSEVSDFDEGLNLGEYRVASDTTVFQKGEKFFAMFNGLKDYSMTFDENGKITYYTELPTNKSKPLTKIDGITYPLFFMPLPNGNIPVALSDHPSLVGIVRFPDCIYSTQEIDIPVLQRYDPVFEGETEVTYGTIIYKANVCTEITTKVLTGSGGTVDKNEVTDFYPYTVYVLTDGEADPLVMKPQDLPSTITVKGKFALSHIPIERYYIQGYKGDNDGKIYNITNANQMMLPTANNTASAYLSTNGGSLSMQRKHSVTENIISGIATSLNVVSSVVGAMSGLSKSSNSNNRILSGLGNASAGFGAVGDVVGGIGSIVSGINRIKESDQRIKDVLLTPNSISSWGTPSTRKAFDTNSVRIVKFTVSETVKNKIRNFVARFGNKYNNYATIDLKSYKGYIKFISPDIDSSIDFLYINKIREILERGVYIE